MTSDCCWWLVMGASRMILYNRCGGRCLDDKTSVAAEYGIHFSSSSFMHGQRTNTFYSFIRLYNPASLGHNMSLRHTHFLMKYLSTWYHAHTFNINRKCVTSQKRWFHLALKGPLFKTEQYLMVWFATATKWTPLPHCKNQDKNLRSISRLQREDATS